MDRNDAPDRIRRLLVLGMACAPCLSARAAAEGGEKASREPATLDPKHPPSALIYQPDPKGWKHCSSCLNYLPAESVASPGACRIVAGPIEPQGYCIAYAPEVEGRQRRTLEERFPKAILHYGDQPHRGRRCGDCINFVDAGGQWSVCHLVQGRIHRDGHCLAWSDESWHPARA